MSHSPSQPNPINSPEAAGGEFDPLHKWLGIPPREQPPNHYRLLAIDLFEADADVIEAAANARMSYVRQCAIGPHANASQQVLNNLSEAQLCLLNPQSKAAYDTQLKSALPAKSETAEITPKKNSRTKAATDPKLAQLTQKLDKQKKQIETLLEKCEFATAISALEKMAAVKNPKVAKYAKWAKQQLPKAKRGTQDMRASSSAMYRTASDLYERNDFEEAAEILQQIPQKYRNRQISELLQECLDLQEEISAIQDDIDHAESLGKYDDLQPAVERLLEIKPNDRRAKKLLKELKTYGKGGGMRLGGRGDNRFDAAGNTSNPLKVAMFVGIPLLLFGIVGYATVVYVRSNNKTIKIEIDDPSAKVIIDGEAVEITGVGDTIKLKVGDHDLTVERDDLVVHTRQFEVLKGKNPVLRISLENEASPDLPAVASATKTPSDRESRDDGGKLASVAGLVAYYPFDQKSGMSVEESSGKGQNGTLKGAPKWVAGKHGGALQLVGKTYVDLGKEAFFDTSDAFSVGAWVLPTQSGDMVIVIRSDGTPDYRGYDLMLLGGGPMVHLQHQWSKGNYLRALGKKSIADGQWHHLMMTYDGSSKAAGVKIYVDGMAQELEVTRDSLNGTIQSSAPLTIGREDPEGAKLFEGTIDDLQIYDRALSASEVKQAMSPQMGTTSTPSAAPDDGGVFLSDLKPTEVQIQGSLLNSSRVSVKVNGVDSPHGLILHPRRVGRIVIGKVSYDLSGKYKRFTGTFGILDSIGASMSSAPITFRIRGDGKVLYSSPPLQKRSSTDKFDVDISQVEILQITTETTNTDWAHAACVEPRLHRGGSPGPAAPSGSSIFLSDLKPTGVKIVGGLLASKDNPVKVNGADSPHGLHLHPQSNGRGSVTFGLNRKYQRLSGAFGVRDDLKTGSGTTTTPVTCKILGDGKTLYTSPPLQKWGSTSDFNVDVSQVNVLQITAETKDDYRAWVACVEPRLHLGGSGTAASPSQPTQVSLVAHYPLDRISGGKFEDAGSGKHHGTIKGRPRSVKGQIGNAIHTVGKSYVDLGSLADFEWSDAFSLGAWVQRPANGHMCILIRSTLRPEFRGYDLMLNGGRPLVHLIERHANSQIRVMGKEAIAAGAWHHVMMTYDGSARAAGVKIYLDGKLQDLDVSVDGLKKTTIKSNQPLVIGHVNPGNETREGKIDDVQIYRGVLSAEQVKQAMTGPVQTSGTAVSDTANSKALTGHENDVNDVAISPDGRLIASGGADTLVKLWDSATGKERFTLRGHTNQVVCVAFSPDGKQLVSGASVIRIWDTTTGKEIRKLVGHTNVVTDVNFSPDGKQLFSSSVDHAIKSWDVATGKEIRTFKGHAVHACSVACSPDGNQIVSSAMDSTIKLWDTKTGRETGMLKGHTQRVNNVVYSPDGKRIASASYDWTVKLWDAATGKELRSLKGHGGAVTILAFSPDGRRIISGSDDKTLKLWDVATGRELDALRGHTGGVFGATFSPDGKQIISGSRDKTVRVWNVATVASAATSPSSETTAIAANRVTARRAAEWALSLGGTIATNVGVVSTIAELPRQPFRVHQIILSKKQVTNEGLANLRGLTSLTDLRLGNTAIDDVGLAHLKDLVSLETLLLEGTQVSDAGLVHLAGMTNLTTLYLDNTPVKGEGLKNLKGMKRLAAVRLTSSQVDDSGLAHLKGLTSLTDLRIGNTATTGAGMVHLEGLKNLSTLVLTGVDLKDEDLVHLKGMTALVTLHLDGTPMQGDGLKYLKDVTQLVALRLSSTQVDDSSLAFLKGMTRLTDLRVAKTRVTAAGAANLQKTLPNCQILR